MGGKTQTGGAMNTQTITLHITLNRGKNLPSRVRREIVDAIEERMERLSESTVTSKADELGVRRIAYEIGGKIVDEYCSVSFRELTLELNRFLLKRKISGVEWKGPRKVFLDKNISLGPLFFLFFYNFY